jgi:phage terminase large subunit-like protein
MQLLEELIQYSQSVINGNIIACVKHKWACMRFLRDLDKRETDSFPWVFDEERAGRYLDWMRLFKHSKGPLAGKIKEPAIYEKFVYGNIYGWVHKDTELRRFRRSYEQLARKNAKSQDKGIQALYEISAFGEQMAEAYVAATKKADTRHVWGEASWLYKNSELLRDKFVTKFDQELQQTVIRHKKSGSFFSRLSKEDKKTGDGTCPQFTVLDEYHLHETTEYYDLASSGMKTREQPLLSIITTAGFELNNPCYRVEYDYVCKILDPDNPIENDRYFVMICEADLDENGTMIDDITSEAARLKANPIIGNTVVGKESIEIDVMEAQDKPEKMRDVLTKTFNIWVNQRSAGYMNMAKWAACGATEDNPFPDVTGMTVFPGLDLSMRIDLTSVSFDIPLPDDRFAVMSHSFIPEETLEQKRKTDKAPYDLWVKEKWITVTPGAEVDYHFVLDYIVKTYKKYKWPIGEACFDRALSTWLMHELADLSFIPVDIGQWFNQLSEPTKDIRSKVYDKKIIHDNNPVLTWAIGNAVVRKGPSENIMLDKGKSTQRIDPIAALINAHVRAMTKEKKSSVYEKRGMRSLL